MCQKQRIRPRTRTVPWTRRKPDIEMRIGKIQLGHHGGSGKFMIEAYDAEADEEAAPTVRVWGSRGHLESFAAEALDVCAAGRPLCPLCGGPIDKTGHVCPRRNGHSKMAPPERPEVAARASCHVWENRLREQAALQNLQRRR